MNGATRTESLRSLDADPSGHVVECPFCGDLAFGVSQGKWANGGDGYLDVIYRHEACPAVDPAARSARPTLLATTPPPARRRRLFARSS